MKPAAKKKKMTDFFNKAELSTKKKETAAPRKLSQRMKPASPPKPKPKPNPQWNSSDDEEDVVVAKRSGIGRAARTEGVKKYVEIVSDDGSMDSD